MRIYISGPMTGLPDNNYPAFHRAAGFWRAVGWEVVNPAEEDEAELAVNPVEKTWVDYIRRDIALLLPCNALAQLPGWQASVGALLEFQIAAALKFAFYDAEQPVVHA